MFRGWYRGLCYELILLSLLAPFWTRVDAGGHSSRHHITGLPVMVKDALSGASVPPRRNGDPCLPESIIVTLGNARGAVELHVSMNHELVRDPLSAIAVSSSSYQSKPMKVACYYSGIVFDHPGSHVAISISSVMNGYLTFGEKVFFVEPLQGNHSDVDWPLHGLVEHVDISPASGSPEQYNDGILYSVGLPTSSNDDDDVLAGTHGQRQQQTKTRRSIGHLYSLEVLVVADEEMIKFHGNDSVEDYILTVMNIVAELFHDQSLGTKINVVVSKLVLLHSDPEDLHLNSNGQQSLMNFCEWQNRQSWYSGSNESEPITYDVAVLITRRDLCIDRDEPCSTLGVSYIGGVCKPTRRCNVNEDVGLSLAFTIAHEIGHSLGMVHDGDENSCPSVPEMPNVMSARWMRSTQTAGLKWSLCSQGHFEAFLRSPQSACLKQKTVNAGNSPLMLPGVVYDADAQCRQQYGSLSSLCTRRKESVCTELWCEIAGETACRSKLLPAAKGTACAPGKWCMFGECFDNGTIPEEIDGDWSEWSEWTSCSRSCGVGVSMMERRCNSPRPSFGGKFCEGERRKYRTCVVQLCPEGSKDFRSMQCESFNGIPFRNQTYNWVAVTSERSPCSLYCRPENRQHLFSALLAPKVIDGTPCDTAGTGICADGRCRKVGCDNNLDSDLERDPCGVCGGDSRTCRVIEGVFTQPSGDGYVEAAIIPAGASNIIVKETKPCASFLALKSGEGSYFINGNWKIELPGDFNVAGTIVHYERRGTWETLYAGGPAKVSFHIMVLFQDFNFGVRYKYVLPLEEQGSSNSSSSLPFVWVPGMWGRCSDVCGGGIVSRLPPMCVHTQGNDSRVVESSNCGHLPRPEDENKVCNEQKCATFWQVSPWSACSLTCGQSFQYRNVSCVTQMKNGDVVPTADHNCPSDQPQAVQACYERACFLQWNHTQWSKCNGPCGSFGYQHRNVMCPVAEACNMNLKPVHVRPCIMPSCSYGWFYTEWSSCSSSCGPGMQTRVVVCRERHTFDDVGADKCWNLSRPEDSRPCQMSSCDNTQIYSSTPHTPPAEGLNSPKINTPLGREAGCQGDFWPERLCKMFLRNPRFCMVRSNFLRCCATCLKHHDRSSE